MHRATTAYGQRAKIPRHYSDESDESSIEDVSDEEGYHLSSKGSQRGSPQGKMELRRAQSSESEESDDSIDYIEQRIKKLEMDLEKRIDKHKKDSEAPKPKQKVQINEPPKAAKVSSPPLPKKVEGKAHVKTQ